MSGMNRHTGRRISGIEHLQQSLGALFTTPTNSRVMRREVHCLLAELIDQPDNGATRVRAYSAVAGAAMSWEPRVRISRVLLERGERPGQATLDLEGVYLPPDGPQQVLALRLPLQMRAGT